MGSLAGTDNKFGPGMQFEYCALFRVERAVASSHERALYPRLATQNSKLEGRLHQVWRYLADHNVTRAFASARRGVRVQQSSHVFVYVSNLVHRVVYLLLG